MNSNKISYDLKQFIKIGNHYLFIACFGEYRL